MSQPASPTRVNRNAVRALWRGLGAYHDAMRQYRTGTGAHTVHGER